MRFFREFDELDVSLRKFERGEINITALCQSWRGQAALLAALPPRYGSVLEDMLARLEASALFTDESCSFSVADLRGSLGTWLEKARAQMHAGQNGPAA